MHTHHSTGANHQMVEVNRPNMNQITCGISSPLITGFNGNCVPVSANIPMTSQDLFNATHFSTLPQPFLQPPPDQSHMHSNLSPYLYLSIYLSISFRFHSSVMQFM